MKKRILSLLLAIVMVVGMLPMPGHVHAVEDHDHSHELESASTGAEEPVCDCGTDDTAIHAVSCPAYVAPENPECFCAEKCAEANEWCDVCGFDVAACGGEDIADNYLSKDKYGYYQIANTEDLYAFAALVNGGEDSANAVLTADIVVNTGTITAASTNARVWTPIGEYGYTGTFDGMGHTISGLYFNDVDESDPVGLFSIVGTYGVVQNVGVKNSYFNGYVYVGGVAGDNSGAIINCYNTGTVKGSFNVGGVVGINSGYTEYCYNTGAVSGNEYVGGVAGENAYILYYCYNSGKVSGGDYVGGVTGLNVVTDRYVGEVYRNYNIGIISGNKYVGGLVGNNEGYLSYGHNQAKVSGSNYVGGVAGESSINMNRCYYLNTAYTGGINGQDVANRAESKTAQQFASGEVAYLLGAYLISENEGTFGQTLGKDSYPVISDATVYYGYTSCADDATPVYTNSANVTDQKPGHTWGDGKCTVCSKACPGAFDNNGFCTYCDNHYQRATVKINVYQIGNAGQLFWFAELANGLNPQVSGVLTADIVVNEDAYSGERVWIPIGSPDKQYNGTFDGQNHTISGLYLRDGNANYTGLFGSVGPIGVVKNVGVEDSYFSIEAWCGGIAGYNAGTIENCYFTGSITCASHTAGIAGENTGTIRNCYFTGTCSGGSYSNIVHKNSGTITNCYYSTNYSGKFDGATRMTSEQFASGEVAYLLGDPFGQTISTDTRPTLGGAKVYTVMNCKNEVAGYSNTEGEILGHDFKNGSCTVCGTACVHSWKDGTCTVCGLGCEHSWRNGTCTVCGLACAHTGGTATCNVKAVCTVCGVSYGEVDKSNHDSSISFDADGFCRNGCYEPATDSDSDGYYEINKAGKLFWVAQQVNDGTNQSIKVKLTADIDLKNREWIVIGDDDSHYQGIFDGQGHAITGLKLTITTGGRWGLFHTGSGATIQNFSIDGAATIDTTDYVTYGVVGCGYNLTVSNVHSSVDLTVERGANNAIGGIVGSVQSGSKLTIDRCSFSGTLNMGLNDVDCLGGIVGYVYAGITADITNCGFFGKITSTHMDTDQIGGILGYYRGSNLTIKNCLSLGNISVFYGYDALAGAIVGVLRQHSSANTKITNNYYYSYKAFGNSSNSDDITDGYGGQTFSNSATSVNATRLLSGEVAYLLNGSSAEGVWKQTIGTDNYPQYTGSTVYKVVDCDGVSDFYSNTNQNRTHNFENGICTVCETACDHADSTHTAYTLGENDTHCYVCTICKITVSESHTVDTNATYTPAGDDIHSTSCAVCANTVYAPHTGGTATCTEQAKCDDCGASYGELIAHSTTADGDKFATCMTLAYCSVCESEYGELDALYHEGPFTVQFDWPEDATGLYMKVSLYCACGEEADYANVYGENFNIVSETEGTDCLAPDTITYSVTVNLYDQDYTDTRTYILPGENHADLDAEGFCSACGDGYQPAVWDEEEGIYEIYTAGQLFWFADYVNNESNDVRGKLMNDITVPEGKNWKPIMNFYGTFDGNFMTVSGLYVKSEGDEVGMFGGGDYSYGTIKNLHLTDSYFEGAESVGGIAGSHAGTIENCYVDGTVTVVGGIYTGALAGSMSGGDVINCYAYSDTLIGFYNRNYVTVENSYYLSDTETEDGGRTAEQFASGEVAYLLQAGQVGEDIWDDETGEWIGTTEPKLVWGQKIGTDPYPVFSDDVVIKQEDGTYVNVPSVTGTLGDLDNDGDVDAYDLTLLARHVGGIELVTGRALLNADVDGDGEVDANDLTMHARYVGGIITSWDQE